jgi:peptide-methionine (R)-S-oxide reductase
MIRVEVRCSRAATAIWAMSFPMGLGENGLRYCINSASLEFKPR